MKMTATGDESDEESDEEEAAHTVMQQQAIQDQTETNLVTSGAPLPNDHVIPGL